MNDIYFTLWKIGLCYSQWILPFMLWVSIILGIYLLSTDAYNAKKPKYFNFMALICYIMILISFCSMIIISIYYKSVVDNVNSAPNPFFLPDSNKYGFQKGFSVGKNGIGGMVVDLKDTIYVYHGKRMFVDKSK